MIEVNCKLYRSGKSHAIGKKQNSCQKVRRVVQARQMK